KKKLKLADFIDDLSVPAILLDQPSPYALYKIEKQSYIKLWYFTQESCVDTTSFHKSTANSYSITKVDDTVALRPTSSFRASGNALADEQLNMQQILIAKTSMLRNIEQLGW
ncbi:hypothetical protein SERLA73DRAFT_36998, partial [Serpula lacrymans var. lacrymans S7.3]